MRFDVDFPTHVVVNEAVIVDLLDTRVRRDQRRRRRPQDRLAAADGVVATDKRRRRLVVLPTIEDFFFANGMGLSKHTS